jgi:DNA-binding transcriptional MerR regulator
MSDDAREWLYIGEVAELFDVTTKTLRHYEELGLLSPQREENDYRRYGPQDVLRVQRIRQLQTLGMSLRQIKAVLEKQDDEEMWATVLRSLREEVEAEIEALEERREQIEELLSREALPVQEGVLPVPEKVNEYLETHLPQASLMQWREENAVLASLGGLWRGAAEGLDPLAAYPQSALAPSRLGLAYVYEVPPVSGEQEYVAGVRRVLQQLEREARLRATVNERSKG